MERIEKIIKKAKEKSLYELLEFSIINLDKPSGPTSFQIDEYLRNIFQTKKTSHFGTLDPKVGGVLPISLKRACRLMRYFIKENKTYVGIMHLHKNIEEEIIEKEIKKFIGKIKQIPPRRSSVKRQERIREIYDFKILEREEKDVLFEVTCEAGTYIRKLIHDFGKNIGGAHMTELRRTRAGIFSENDEEFIDLYKFDNIIEKWKGGEEKELRKILIPGEIILKILPSIKIKDNDEIIKKLYNGFPLKKEYFENKNELNQIKEKNAVCAITENDLIGIYEIVYDKSIVAKPQFVYKKDSKV